MNEKKNNKEKEKIITVNLKVVLSPWLSNQHCAVEKSTDSPSDNYKICFFPVLIV